MPRCEQAQVCAVLSSKFPHCNTISLQSLTIIFDK